MTPRLKNAFSWLLRAMRFASFAVLLSLFPLSTPYIQSVPQTLGVADTVEIELPAPPPIPINVSGVPVPYVNAKGVMIRDLSSGVNIYEKSESEVYAPASTTKIMSALVAMDHFRPDDVLTVQTVITDGRVMGLVEGETITFESLLYGMLVHSANDAAYTIAENYPGGVKSFVSMMNQKAEEMDLSRTHFTNPIGFDDPDHVSTLSDLAKQTTAALRDKTFAKIVGTQSITVSDTNFTYFHPLTNVNELLGKIPGLSGVKTGYTDIAGGILISEIRRNGREILVIVLNSPDRFGDTTALINWVFEAFTWMDLEDIIPANPD